MSLLAFEDLQLFGNLFADAPQLLLGPSPSLFLFQSLIELGTVDGGVQVGGDEVQVARRLLGQLFQLYEQRTASEYVTQYLVTYHGCGKCGQILNKNLADCPERRLTCAKLFPYSLRILDLDSSNSFGIRRAA